MRTLTCIALVLAVGCSNASSGPDSPLPPDLRTRKTGIDWPCFLGPTGDSVSPEKGLLASWPKDGPRIVWEKKMAEGYATTSISRGRAFVFDRLRHLARLQALKSETGEHIWSFEYTTDYADQYNYSGGPRCCPVVDGDRVYIFGPEGMLHCIKAEDGKLVWKLDTQKEFNVRQNFFGVGSTPVIEGDLLIAMIGGSPPDSKDTPFDELKGNGTGVVAFDKYTGQVKWKSSDELASYSSPVLATMGKQRRLFVFARGGLLGMDPTSGKVDFHYPWRARDLESVNASNPVVVGHKVFITETYGPGGSLLEMTPDGYKEVWTDAKKGRDKSMQCHWNTPIHVDGYLYGSSGRHTGNAELRCIELATGKVMWSVADLTRCSLLLVDGHFICLAEDGTLMLLKVNPKKYEEVSRVQLTTDKTMPENEAAHLLKYPCWAAPVLSHGLLYVRGKDRLVCLEVIPEKK
jgi:hypothetical protein